MLGPLAHPKRRSLWGVLTLVLVIAITGAFVGAAGARSRLTQRAETQARLTAQMQLAPLLTSTDLEGPISGERAMQLQSDVQREIVSTGPITAVRIYSQLGRILFDVDPSVSTVRPTSLRDRMFEVAHGAVRSEVWNSILETYVPVWLAPGGAVVVAEMSQPFGPIAAEANRPWYLVALLLGIALVVTTTLFVLSLLAKARVTAAQVQMDARSRALEGSKEHAEQRARASEAALKDLQAQFRMTLDQLMDREVELKLREHQSEEIADLHHRLDVAQRRGVELDSEVERLQAELDAEQLRRSRRDRAAHRQRASTGRSR